MTLYYVGIDGGGTSCRARIRDCKGTLVGEAKSGSANILLGVEVAMASLTSAITDAATQGGLTLSDFSNMHVGLALAGACALALATARALARALALCMPSMAMIDLAMRLA